jgi:hypothetical protein
MIVRILVNNRARTSVECKQSLSVTRSLALWRRPVVQCYKNFDFFVTMISQTNERDCLTLGVRPEPAKWSPFWELHHSTGSLTMPWLKSLLGIKTLACLSSESVTEIKKFCNFDTRTN